MVQLIKLKDEEKTEILDAANQATHMRVYPKKIQHIWQSGITNLRKILDRQPGWMFISETDPFTESRLRVCDIFIFHCSRPVTVMTLTTVALESDLILRHNTLAAKSVVSVVQKLTPHVLSVVHGVIAEDVWRSEKTFHERINNMESVARSVAIPRTLDMDVKKHVDITRAVLYMTPQQTDQTNQELEVSEYEKLKCLYDELQNELRKLKSENKVLKWKQSMADVSDYDWEYSDSDNMVFDESVSHPPAPFAARVKKIHSSSPSTSKQSDTSGNQRYRTGRLPSTYSFSSTDRETGEEHGSISEESQTPLQLDEWSPSRTDDLAKVDEQPTGSLKDITEVFDHLISNGGRVAVSAKDGQTIMHLFCSKGNAVMVEYLLQKGIFSVDCRGRMGRTPIIEAALNGHKNVFDLLMRSGCDLSATDDNNDCVLNVACLSDNINFVTYLLSLNIVDINVKGKWGRTPVMNAASQGCRRVFELLENKGCKLTVFDVHKDCILHVACLSDNVEIVAYLLTLKIFKIDVRGYRGRTPIMNSASTGCRKVFDLLREKGSDLSLVDDKKDTLLHIASRSDNADFVKYLLSLGIIHIDTRGYKERTPVMQAAARGSRSVIDVLIKEGCDLSLRDKNKDSILHAACRSGSLKLVQYLLQLDICDINIRGHRGRTPAMMAAAKGWKQMFDLLKQHGSNLEIFDDNGDSILHAACLSNDEKFVKYILSLDILDINTRGFRDRTPLMVAAVTGCRNVFDILMKNSADVSMTDEVRNNILHLACFSDREQFVEHILDLAIADINSRGEFGRTPLMIAANYGCQKVFDLLLERGGNLLLVDSNNSSILNIACLEDNAEFVDHLLSMDFADINIRGYRGNTPVMQAASKGCQKVFDLLVRNGCDLSVASSDGDTVLHAACLGGNVSIVEYVLTQKTSAINSIGQHGRSPIMLAALKGHLKVFELLLKQKSDLVLTDDEGANILHLACVGGNVHIIQYLLSMDSVNTESRTNDGHTPAEVAQIYGRQELYDLIQTSAKPNHQYMTKL